MNNLNLNLKVRKFFSSYPLLKFTAGEKVIRQTNAKLSHLYYVEEGLIRQSILSKDRQVVYLNMFKPGSLFPIILTMNDLPNRFNFVAVTPTAVREAKIDQVEKFLLDNPDVLYDLTCRLGKGLVHLVNAIEILTTNDARSRVLAVLKQIASSYGKQSGKSWQIDFPLTHTDIGRFVGLARETVTRELVKLKRSGIFRKNHDQIIIN